MDDGAVIPVSRYRQKEIYDAWLAWFDENPRSIVVPGARDFEEPLGSSPSSAQDSAHNGSSAQNR
jgi:hypothetical protein